MKLQVPLQPRAYTIGHYNTSVIITTLHLTPLMLCAVILYMSCVAYNLTSSHRCFNSCFSPTGGSLSGIYPKKLVTMAKMNLKKFNKLSTQINNKIPHYIADFYDFKLRFVDLRRCQRKESEEN